MIEALRDVGFDTVERHAVALPRVDFLGDARAQTGEIVIRRKHIGRASNDIGFARRADSTYEAIISGFDRIRYDQAWLNRRRGRPATR